MSNVSDVPKWRIGRVNDLASGTAQMLVELVAEARDAIPSCLNCAYFTESHYWCGKFNAVPPARIIVHACPGYADIEGVPF